MLLAAISAATECKMIFEEARVPDDDFFISDGYTAGVVGTST